jgi:hypothetical protein
LENLHLIAGLGNPGPEYAATRHNIGFVLVERLAADWKAAWKVERKFRARLARVKRGGERVILCQPHTFMNESGVAVGALARTCLWGKSACGPKAAAAATTGWSRSSGLWAGAGTRACDWA